MAKILVKEKVVDEYQLKKEMYNYFGCAFLFTVLILVCTVFALITESDRLKSIASVATVIFAFAAAFYWVHYLIWQGKVNPKVNIRINNVEGMIAKLSSFPVDSKAADIWREEIWDLLHKQESKVIPNIESGRLDIVPNKTLIEWAFAFEENMDIERRAALRDQCKARCLLQAVDAIRLHWDLIKGDRNIFKERTRVSIWSLFHKMDYLKPSPREGKIAIVPTNILQNWCKDHDLDLPERSAEFHKELSLRAVEQEPIHFHF